MECPFSDQKLQIVKIIGQGLGELPYSVAWFQIGCALEVMPGKQLIGLCQKALEVYHSGGLEKEEGKKRTLGGTFFKLFKDECSVEQLRVWYRLKRNGMVGWCAYKDQIYIEKKQKALEKKTTRPQDTARSVSDGPYRSAQKDTGQSTDKSKKLQKMATA